MYLIIYSPELINMGLGETCSPKACLLTTYLQLLFFTKLMQSNKMKKQKKLILYYLNMNYMQFKLHILPLYLPLLEQLHDL